MERVELWPFSQGEIDRTADSFVDTAFGLGPDLRYESAVTRADYSDRLVRGGLPEAVARTDPRRRGKFLDAYVQNLIDRDVRQLTEIERAPQLGTLIRLLAARSGLLVAPGSLESDLQISRPTVARYMRLLEEVFLVKRIPGWSRNLGTRATAAPKLIYVDSGIAARLLALDSHALRRPGAPFGPLLEGFVLSELTRQLTWSEELAVSRSQQGRGGRRSGKPAGPGHRDRGQGCIYRAGRGLPRPEAPCREARRRFPGRRCPLYRQRHAAVWAKATRGTG
jgi:predicted AAA+ superfamily ATPase